MSQLKHFFLAFTAIALIGACHSGGGDNDEASQFYYPSKPYRSLQELIDKVPDDAVIRVKAGVYDEGFEIRNKRLSIIGDNRNSVFESARATCVLIKNGDGSVIDGLSFRNCEDGVLTDSRIEIRNSLFLQCGDAIDFEDGSGGLVYNNIFYDQTDDAIDLDDGVAVEIVQNQILNSADDGIEIRLPPYSGDTLEILITDNVIHASQGNGIQFIDYEVDTPRRFTIERNSFSENEFNDISYSDNEITAPSLNIGTISETVNIIRNIFRPKQQSFSGHGDNTVLRNNSFFSPAPAGGLNLLPGFDSDDNNFILVI